MVTRWRWKLNACAIILRYAIYCWWGTQDDDMMSSHRLTISNLVLFQKTYPLLQASTVPKFIVMSSIGGSFIRGAPVPGYIVYGASKAAVNYLTRKIHFECPNISSNFVHHTAYCERWHLPTIQASFSICPGLVKSNMGVLALLFSAEDASSTIPLYQPLLRWSKTLALTKLKVCGLKREKRVLLCSWTLLKKVTREKDGGTFAFCDGSRLPWWTLTKNATYPLSINVERYFVTFGYDVLSRYQVAYFKPLNFRVYLSALCATMAVGA